jgi:putative sterol carrier protein
VLQHEACRYDTASALSQAFLLRKLKIGGSMGMALKLQPILDAAQPKSKM